MDWTGKQVAVIGFGREGQAAVRYLLQRGAVVTVCEAREDITHDAAYLELRDSISWRLGATYLDALTSFDFIMRSPGVRTWPQITAAVEAGVELTSPTNEFFQRCPAKIIGVTGTKGKGTTASLIAAILRQAGRTVHLLGNIGTPAIAALGIIKEDDLVVYELSSFQLQDLTTSPHLAVVLGITAEHQDYHTSVADYIAAKANIIRYQGEKDIAIINIDYPANEQLAENVSGQLIPISTKRFLEYGVCLSPDTVVSSLGGLPEDIFSIASVRLPGRFNLENVIAATAVGIALHIPKEAIAEAVGDFVGLPHRLEHVRDVDGVSYWNNSYATTPEATAAAVQSFTAPIVLLLGGIDKGSSYEDFAASVSASPVKAVVGIGKNAPALYTAITAAAEKLGKTSPPYIIGGETMADMVRVAKAAATSGTVVLLSPAAASFDKFLNATDRGEQFRAAVLALP